MTDTFPEAPALPPAQVATRPVPFRFDDVTQDGRVNVLTLPHALATVAWGHLLRGHPIAGLGRVGIVPVVSRVVLEGGRGAVAPGAPVDCTAQFGLFHGCDASGAVDRILLNVWATVAGDVGRVLVEYTLTRPSAPAAERRVVRLEGELPAVPPERWPARAADAVLELPPGARSLDGIAAEPAVVAFGLDHTDINRHVTSFAYPRLFIDAALQQFAAQGRGTKLLCRFVEAVYRKPSFAGERITQSLRAFEIGDGLGALGGFRDDKDPRPRCVVRASFMA